MLINYFQFNHLSLFYLINRRENLQSSSENRWTKCPRIEFVANEYSPWNVNIKLEPGSNSHQQKVNLIKLVSETSNKTSASRDRNRKSSRKRSSVASVSYLQEHLQLLRYASMHSKNSNSNKRRNSFQNDYFFSSFLLFLPFIWNCYESALHIYKKRLIEKSIKWF